MGRSDRPNEQIRFGDDTTIEGDLVTGTKVSTGEITASDGSTVNVAGRDVFSAGGDINIIEKLVIQGGGEQPVRRLFRAAMEGLPIDDLVFYSVDCDPQIHTLEESLVEQSDMPCCMLACMLPGDTNQAQDMFLKRLQVDVLPKVLGLDLERTPLAVYQLLWPGQLQKLEDAPRLLNKSLAESVLGDKFATLEAVRQRLASLQGPILIQTHIYHDAYQSWGVKAFQAYLDFWKDWPELAPNQRLLIFVCIYYEPPKKKSVLARIFRRDIRRDLQRFMEDLPAEAAGASQWVGLPALIGATLTDATNWAHRDEIAARFESAGIVEELQEVYQAVSAGEGSAAVIPLATLGRKLKEIVPRYIRT